MGGTCFAEFYFTEDVHHVLIYPTHQVSLESVENSQRYECIREIKRNVAWAVMGFIYLFLKVSVSASQTLIKNRLAPLQNGTIIWYISYVKNATSTLGTKYTIKI